MIPRLAVALALVLVGAARAAAAGPGLEPAPCPNEIPQPALETARCGFLVVPENRSNPDGQTIRLMVAVVPAVAKDPAPDPLVYLEGGPGGIAILEAQRLVDAGFNRDRDLILMDQRGTLYSQPALTCPVIDRFNERLLGMRFDSARARRAHLAATRACRKQLVAEGVDLGAYNTTENAADFADLRRALGYEQWDLFGVSYGTDLALTYVRTDPAGIRSVVLDSPVPPWVVALPGFWPNARDGFDDLFRACGAQRACRKAHSRLRATFTGLVRNLERHPARTRVKDRAGDGRRTVVLDGGALANWLVAMSFATPSYKDVPAWIDQLAAGRPQAIAASRLGQVAPPGFTGYGLTYGVACREWVPFAPAGGVLPSGRKVFPRYPASVLAQPPQFTYMDDDCRIWDVPPAPASFREPVWSDIPTLILSGSFDAVTPLAWAKAAARTLPHSTVVSIPGVGHFVAPESPCAQTVLASFWARPDAPDTSCVATLRPPTFAAG